MGNLGAQIRKRRLEQRISLRGLARRSGLTASFISLVENEKVNLSVNSLCRIADALGIQMINFLSEEGQTGSTLAGEVIAPDAQIELLISHLLDRTSPLVKSNLRTRLFLPDSGITYELLTRQYDRKMEAFIGRIAPGTGNIAARLHGPTEVFIYCLVGSLKVEIRDQIYLLEPGDSICFKGLNLTCMANGSATEESTWLSVITPLAF